MRSLTAIWTCIALLAIGAAGASAQSGSEFEQYVPDLPAADQPNPLPDALDDDKGGGGNDGDAGADDSSTAPTSPAPSAPSADSSPAAGLDDLAAKGPEGETAARIAHATAPERPGPGPEVTLADADGASPGSSLFDLLGGGSGGIGGWFPLALVITLGAAVVYALRKSRA